jgi:hypothetical protein
MSPTMLTDDTEPELELEPEPEPEAEPEPEPEAEPEPEPSVALARVPLMDVLPVDFALPALIRFVPDVRLRAAADEATAYALGIAVTGADGLQKADVAVTALKASLKAIEEHFAEPTDTANQLHKRLTGMRSEWVTNGKTAAESVGRRIWTEQRRLAEIEAAERRRVQEEEDKKAREKARQEMEAARAAQAPAAVVKEMQRQAETATAPPVASTASAPPPLKSSSVVTTWKARIAGTPGSDDPNPEIEALSPAQRIQVLALLKAILDGSAPLAAIQVNWTYLSKRAKADKSTLAIAGIEAFEDGGIRSKGARSK